MGDAPIEFVPLTNGLSQVGPYCGWTLENKPEVNVIAIN